MNYLLKKGTINKLKNSLLDWFLPNKGNNYLPKVLKGKFLLILVLTILFLKLFSALIFINFPRNIFFADITKNALVTLVNNERTLLGLNQLKENDKLNQAAMLKAQDIMKGQYFSHNSPDGVTPWYWFLTTGYNYKYAGENLAIGFLESEQVYKAWLNSESHRDILLSSNYKEVGTAVLEGDFQGNKATVVVQLFGTQKTSFNTALSVKPADNVLESKNNLANNIEPVKPVESPKTQDLADNKKVLSESSVNTDNSVKISQSSYVKDGNLILLKFLGFVLSDGFKTIDYLNYFIIVFMVFCIILGIYFKKTSEAKLFVLRNLSIIFLVCINTLLSKNILMQIFPHRIFI